MVDVEVSPGRRHSRHRRERGAIAGQVGGSGRQSLSAGGRVRVWWGVPTSHAPLTAGSDFGWQARNPGFHTGLIIQVEDEADMKQRIGSGLCCPPGQPGVGGAICAPVRVVLGEETARRIQASGQHSCRKPPGAQRGLPRCVELRTSCAPVRSILHSK
jgi:hypothetical protein